MQKLTPDQRAALLKIVAAETNAQQSLEFIIGRTDDDVYVAPLNRHQAQLTPLVILPDWLEVWETRNLIEVGRGLSGLSAGNTFVLTAEAHTYAQHWALPGWRRWLKEEWEDAKSEWRATLAGIVSALITSALTHWLWK
ncbi:MAG TPA: hypothetical protein PKH77_28360 [Anaerolineae bacterium]|nr:hypothetical protein [Anaerolineae bacterium]